jgi:hypothetical protein
LKQPKLAQLDKVLLKWFTAMRSKGKSMAWPTIIGKAKSFYDEMKITDKCTLFDGWLQNFKDAMASESWILVVKCCLLTLRLQNGMVNYSIILCNSINLRQPGFIMLMILGSFGSVCPTAL